MNHKELNFKYTEKLQIRFNDIDMLGHVNNISIQEFFDLGRIKYLTKTLGDLLDTKSKHLVIVSYKTSFFSQILFDNEIEVKTKVYEIGNKSIKMAQAIVDENGKTMATNDCVLVGFDFQKNESIIIPQLWKDALIKFEDNEINLNKDR